MIEVKAAVKLYLAPKHEEYECLDRHRLIRASLLLLVATTTTTARPKNELYVIGTFKVITAKHLHGRETSFGEHVKGHRVVHLITRQVYQEILTKPLLHLSSLRSSAPSWPSHYAKIPSQ